MRLLLVEDHRALSEMVAGHLAKVGFVVDSGGSAEDASTALGITRYDGIVLDLGLPGASGMAVLEHVRRRASHGVPVLILTARDSLESRLAGLNAGADDYLVKPFDLRELEARLRAVLRRPGPRQTESFELGNLTFDVSSWDARVDAQSLDLGRKEFALLEELMRSAPRIVIKDQLEDRLYAIHEAVTPNAIEAIVSRLRKKLQAAGARVQIATVRGVGYKMTAEARALADE
ncbi:two-component system OmpR family response regulator [Azospirillum sp. OGB3]|uniref:response regulator n=1 Tax=Azospirillum sp. OGB3 TaxID=2587012 RepID=UPI00160612F6|nr:two-component system OmpR family response regulator [Azospirillum sp. OGB3]